VRRSDRANVTALLEARIARLRAALHDVRMRADAKPSPVLTATMALLEDDLLASPAPGVLPRAQGAYLALRQDVRAAVLAANARDDHPALRRLLALMPESDAAREGWLIEILAAARGEGGRIHEWHQRYDAAIRAGQTHVDARASAQAPMTDVPPHRCDQLVEQDLRQRAREALREATPDPQIDPDGVIAKRNREYAEKLCGAAEVLCWGLMSYQRPPPPSSPTPQEPP
jgi:hypothetical protein